MNTNAKRCILAGLGLGLAGGVAYIATRSAGPIPMPKFVEERIGSLQEHVVSPEQLGLGGGEVRMHYPARVGPGLTAAISHGFAPLYKPCDPQIAALPAEQD